MVDDKVAVGANGLPAVFDFGEVVDEILFEFLKSHVADMEDMIQRLIESKSTEEDDGQGKDQIVTPVETASKDPIPF